MKILQVCHRYDPFIGGIEEHVRNICQRLTGKHEMTVFTTDPSGKLPRAEIVDGIRVERFRAFAPNESYYFSLDLKRNLMQKSAYYDILHAHGYHAFPALYAAQAKNNNRLLFTPHYHGLGHSFLRSLLHFPYRKVAKTIFEKSDAIICVSRHEMGLLLRNFRIDIKKVCIIPHGIDLEDFKDLRKPRRSRQRDLVILYVGRLEEYKGIHFLIKVLPQLCNSIRLEIVGKGPIKSKLQRLAKKLGVEDRVTFLQNLSRPELLQKYVDAGLFAMLSKLEAYCISVAEALAAQTPCIVANTSALAEWVDDENCFGIDYPIYLNELAKLVEENIGKSIPGVELPSLERQIRTIASLYDRIKEL